MKRRTFLRTVGAAAGAAGAAALPGVLADCTGRSSSRPRGWTWVHGGADRSPEEWRHQFERLSTAGIGGVLVSGGETSMLADAAHAAGLEFHRWVWVLNRSGDQWVKENHPEWFTVARTGESSLTSPPYVGYYQWLCPTREPVREYLREKIAEVAEAPGVDGVHLDYIRHCDVILPVGLWEKYGLLQDREYPFFDFCYCDVCRETFAQESGRDPMTLPDPPSDRAWREFRWKGVTELVRVLATEAHEHGKRISAAVFPTPQLARMLVRQAWDQWPLDAVFPMLYHRFYREDVPWIGRATQEGVAALPSSRPLYSGLYLPDLPPEDLRRAVRASLDGGASGVSLFAMGGLTDPHLEVLRGFRM